MILVKQNFKNHAQKEKSNVNKNATELYNTLLGKHVDEYMNFSFYKTKPLGLDDYDGWYEE